MLKKIGTWFYGDGKGSKYSPNKGQQLQGIPRCIASETKNVMGGNSEGGKLWVSYWDFLSGSLRQGFETTKWWFEVMVWNKGLRQGLGFPQTSTAKRRGFWNKQNEERK